jgi:hypothetical protein
MKHVFVLIMVISVMLCLTTYAQDQSTRFEKQHNAKYLKSHLKQIQDNLLKSLESTNSGVVASTVQALRELEQIFPENDFNSFIDPLGKIVQDEKAETQTRLLSALALDGLHSDKGDKAIYDVAKSSNNKSVQDICIALSLESLKSDLAGK